MKIECLIKRTSDTDVPLDGKIYKFQANPFAEKDQPVTSVCNVDKEEHIKVLLARPHFREYDPKRTQAETLRDTISANVLQGVEIRKYKDAGYIIVDRKRTRFAGTDGEWRDTAENMTPFSSEIAAYEWLKESVANGDFEGDPEETKPRRGRSLSAKEKVAEKEKEAEGAGAGKE